MPRYELLTSNIYYYYKHYREDILHILTAMCTDNLKQYTIKWMAVTFL